MFGIDTLNILVQKWLNKGIGIKKKKIDNIEGCKNCSLTKRSPSRVLSKRCRFSICWSSNGAGTGNHHAIAIQMKPVLGF